MKEHIMRLTNSTRDSIVADVMQATFKKEQEAFKKEENALALRLYNHVVAADVQKTAKKLPPGWIQFDSCLRFNLNGMDVRLDLIDKKGVPVPCDRHSCQRLGNIADDELRDSFLDYRKRFDEYEARRAKTRTAVGQLVYGLHTYKQLCEAWPDGKKFYQAYKPKTEDSNLPAIIVDDVNKMLGLGSK